MYKKYMKRLIDVVLSLSGMILASWLYLIIIVAIKIDDPGPVFFKQKRVGVHKQYFMLIKFRTMKMSTPHDTFTGESRPVHNKSWKILTKDKPGRDTTALEHPSRRYECNRSKTSTLESV
jgi:lipopolysaccharide/colanic/teichoic acid biosynthesis glycosyltransferase